MTAGATVTATSAFPTARHLWTRGRGLLLALVIILAAAVTMAAVRSGDQHGRLDPRSADQFGSRALAELLKDRGVSVEVTTTLAATSTAVAPDTTLLVPMTNLLSGRQQRSLREALAAHGARGVFVGAGRASMAVLAPGVRTDTSVPVSALTPGCSLPAAVRAGDVDLGGERYTTELAGADACYTSDGAATMLRIDTGATGDSVFLGSPDILYNDRLDERGNASLALQLLGSRSHVVWYLPSLSDPSASAGDDSADGFFDLIPSGWLWGTFQLFIAAVITALWRARRLGRLVPERLPVAIRASESSEGRARLYRKVNAREHAAGVLRTASRDRLAHVLGVPPAMAHHQDTLITAVTARLPERPGDLRTLLFGPAPADDSALILLADQLDVLERKVRTS